MRGPGGSQVEGPVGPPCVRARFDEPAFRLATRQAAVLPKGGPAHLSADRSPPGTGRLTRHF